VDLRARSRPDPVAVGAKAASIGWLAGSGAKVPRAVAVPADIAARAAAGETLAVELLAGALRRWLDPDGTYAVRSSADGEDGELRSFAGQFESRLDVPADGVLAAVREVAAPDGARLAAYAERLDVPVPTRVGVVVQAMVPRSSAGIAFSRNPLTGLDEVVIEALDARGDRIADDGATPDRWVWRWGAFTESPVAPRVPAPVIEDVVRETRRLARLQGRPVDLEWASDGGTTWWLQVRPMTGLAGLRIYSNRIARDVLPGVIRPLVWSVNIPVVNSAWIRVLGELVGPLDLAPEDLARSFGYRAYFDMTTIGGVFEAVGMPFDTLELLLGMPKGPEAPRFRPGGSAVRHLPRLAGTARRTLARGRWARTEIRELEVETRALAAVEVERLDGPALLAHVDAVAALARRAAYANIVVPLAMGLYDRALARLATRAGLDPLELDPTAGRDDRGAWGLGAAMGRLAAVAAALPPEARARLQAEGVGAIGDDPALAAFAVELEAYLARDGRCSDSANDLSRPAWRERPDDVVRLACAHQAPVLGRADGGLAQLMELTPRPQRPLVRLLWRRAGAFRVYRDAVGAAWARAYGLFRPAFLALGARLMERGVLDRPEDVMELRLDELRAIVAGEAILAGIPADVILARRREVEQAADLVVPPIVYGDAFQPLPADGRASATLTGIPAARGTARGPARVVTGVADVGRVQHGDVLVVPFADVAWTPLFGRASAVVTEAGGILSHAAVVAREYGIPCVVSVHEATTAITDGAMVLVDGMTGQVRVESDAGSGGPGEDGEV
jgi:pyruvate,water dikinase